MTTAPAASLRLDSWTVVDDGRHNAFTDLASWRGKLWLAYVASPSHFASRRSRIVLLRSSDGRAWQEAARFDGAGEDIRDPKLAVIHDRLTVYALLNRAFDPLPYQTVSADSPDGKTWSPLAQVRPEGWLLGKPKTPDGQAWYAPAHHLQKGAAQLLRTVDGCIWEPVSTLRAGDGADESAIEFLPDGRLLAVTRLEGGEGLFGGPRAGSLLSFARPPYIRWSQVFSDVTRLDGPTLFSIGSECFAVGRRQPCTLGRLQEQGSILARKRTALFRTDGSSLTHLADLPSAGDTAYAGAAQMDGRVFISYYTNDVRRDMPWIAGMFLPTAIRAACLPLEYLSSGKGV